MALNYSPKVGEVLECDFGNYRSPALQPRHDGLIPNEIRKRRMVVVMNGKLPNGCCLVIPISSSGNQSCVQRGFHVHVPPTLIASTQFYECRDRWVITECVAHVSKDRLYKIKEHGAPVSNVIPRDMVTRIQRAMIKTLNASALLSPDNQGPGLAVEVDLEGLDR